MRKRADGGNRKLSYNIEGNPEIEHLNFMVEAI
jgi:hypothetical protein